MFGGAAIFVPRSRATEPTRSG